MDSNTVLAAWEVNGAIEGGWRNWPPARKAVAAEQVALTKAGFYHDEIDGYAGDNTRIARAVLAGPQPTQMPPTPVLSPVQLWPLQGAACDAFYGNPRGNGDNVNQAWYAANVTHVLCPWELHMDAIKLHDIEIHKKCAASLTRVLNNIWDACDRDQAKIEALHYDKYSGSFNYRPMRGKSNLSCHGYAVAIDWDSDENEQHSQKHLFQDDSLLVVKFKEEHWTWGGDWSPGSIDAMHVQAARVHP